MSVVLIKSIKNVFFKLIYREIDMSVWPEYQIVVITIPLFIVGNMF